MSLFAALETKSLFEAFLSFFWSEFPDFYEVNIHGIGVFGHRSRGGEGLEGPGRPPASLDNLFCAVPLILEVDGFQIPLINFIQYRVQGHDLLHEQGGDSISKETD